MIKSDTYIVIATGGSGGHVIPSEILAQKLKSHGANVSLMGHGIKENPFSFKNPDVVYQNISSSPIVLKRFAFVILQMMKGIIQSLTLFSNKKPDCVVGFGSYHSFPVLFAAWLLNIPIALYESNTTMGKVIKVFSKKAKIVASPFNLYHGISTFLHVRPLLKANLTTHDFGKKELFEYFDLDDQKKTILIIGGSQGALFFNQILSRKLTEELSPDTFQIIHLVGKNHKLEDVKNMYSSCGLQACVKSYEDKMDLAYKAADLVICRSGATTLFELDLFQKKAILIPFTKSADQHQILNADYFLKFHHGFMLEEHVIHHIQMLTVIEKVLKEEVKLANAVFMCENELDQKVLSLC